MLVHFEQVNLTYAPDHVVLKDISFGIAEGGFYILTGKSGAGKTSLLQLIACTEKPTAGKIYLFGTDVTFAARHELTDLRRQMGIVFQDFRLIPNLTAVQNVALPLRLAGQDDASVERHAKELLAWVGMEKRMEAWPSELSGGEQQRVAIARAVVNNPKLLLADEPTGNVDDETAQKLFHLFEQLNKMGTAVIIATHQKRAVERLRRPSLHLDGGLLTEIPAVLE